MKKLLESLKNTMHPDGTYCAILPSRESAAELYSFMSAQEVGDLEDSSEYHCTLIYSEAPCPDIATEDFNLPCEAIPKCFSLFGENNDVLVLELYCPNAIRLNGLFIEKYGATSTFKDYKAHITVSKQYSGPLPKDVPDFNIVFTGFIVEELG